jgi:O-antigen biosynthesis protein
MSQDFCTDSQGSSVETYLELLKKDPNNVDTLVALGTISDSLGRISEARIFFHRALALEPWNSAAKLGILHLPPLTPDLDIAQVLLSVTEALSNDISNRTAVHESAEKESTSTLQHNAVRCFPANTSNLGETMAPSDIDQTYYSCSRPEIQQLVKPTSRRILDVGCAAGILGYELKQKLGAEVWGVEYIPMAAEQAEKRLDRVLQGTIEELLPLLPDGYFDTIIMADVLEHLVDPWQVLKTMQAKLAEDGEIVVSVPNVRHWSVVKSLLEGNWQYEDAGILDRTHLRFFTRTECVSLFETAGYLITRSEAIVLKGDEPAPATIVNALQKAGLNVGTLAEESLHYQYAFVAKAARSASQISALHAPMVQGLTSIIILTWNQLPFTMSCLASIAKHTTEPYELIIIDNGSTDGTIAWLREQAVNDTRIHIIENSTNRGFAAGCNQGIECARGEYILLLNNDTVVTPGWLTGLREVLDRYPDAGIVGPMTNNASGVQVVADIGYSSLEELPTWAISFRENNRYRVIPLRRIVGFCLLLKRELVEQIGLLDESFGPGNYEHDDYCLRAELAGYRNLVAGDVFLYHEGGATFSGNRMNRGGENRKNRTIFTQKWDSSGLEESILRRWLALNAIEEGERLAQQGEVDTAVDKLLNEAIKVDPTSPAPYFGLAEILIAAGRHDDVLQVLPEMPPVTDRTVLCEIEAVCHAALGDDESARQAATQAKERPRALVVLGTLAARSGDLVKAEALFRQAADRDPSCGSAWLSLGMLLWGNGDQEAAYQAVRRSVVVEPLNNNAITILRDMAERNSIQDDVLQIIAGAAQLYPDSRNLGRHHAELLVQCGQDREALAACESLLVKFAMDEELLNFALLLRRQIGTHDHLAESGKHSISLCMIVKNEEKYLPTCLASLKPAVDEIIVVDTGSSDRTAAIATVFGAKVSSFVWNGNFSDARNCAINEAGGSWILVMDADEVLSAHDYEAVCHSVRKAGDKKIAWRVLTRNYTTRVNAQGWTPNDHVYPMEERSDGWHPSWKVRLFPNQPDIRFNGDVHEMVENSLLKAGYTIQKASFVVHHYGGLEDSAEEAAEKGRRYFEIGMKKLEKNPHDAVALAELAVQAGEIGRFEEAVRLWDRLLESSPDNVEALFNKGYVLINQQRYQEALAISARVLDLAPDHKEAAFNYGTSALYVGIPAKALEKLEPLLQRYPEYPPLLAVMTLLYLLSGQREKGLSTYSTLKVLNYAITDYAKARADVLIGLGKDGLARRLLDECASIGMDVR